MNAHARNTDPATSHQAAASVDNLTAKQKAVLDVFKEDAQETVLGIDEGLTDEGMIDFYQSNPRSEKQTESGLRTRRSELVTKGLLVDSGKRRNTRAGRKSIVWKLAPSHEGHS